MKAYITTKSPLDGATEDVIRFQHDDYADEDYAILTLAGFTKILEFAQGWASENLETTFYDDVDALIADYCREHSPSRLAILANEEAKQATRERYEQWVSDDTTAVSSTIASGESTVAALQRASDEYLERDYEKKRKARHYSMKTAERGEEND